MRQMWVVCQEELRRAFGSPGTYALLALFFFVTGVLYFSVFTQASSIAQRISPLQMIWELQWLPTIFWVPLITMRSLAAERRMGLLEATLATPTTPASLVLGKYLAAFVVYCSGWLSVGVYMLITAFVGLSPSELAYVFNPTAIWGGVLFCLTSGVLFLALGIWCSSLTRNTIIAGALTVCLLLLYMLLPAMLRVAEVDRWDVLRPFFHLENLSQYTSGAIELSVVVAYVIGALILLFSAMLSLERKGD